jgi:hypothetical protein
MNTPHPGSNLRRGVCGDGVLSCFNGKPPFFVGFCPEKEAAPETSDAASTAADGQRKRRSQRPSAAVFSFAYSFEHTYFNI